jgi:hypothetical protein
MRDEGIPIGLNAPSWGWRDQLGVLRPDPGGANSPTLTAVRGGSCRDYAYTANDKMDIEFHIPHDWIGSTDIFIHAHWMHNGTAISGSNVMTLAYTMAKKNGIFGAEKSQTITVSTPDVATIPQYSHRIDEIQLTDATGTGNYLDRSACEVDALIIVSMTQTTIPTITGGSPNEPFLLHMDLHYQSSNVGTRQRAPDFYT